MENKKLNDLLKSIFASLTEEQKKKAAACKTLEELTAVLTEAGVELSDELLDAVNGGLGREAIGDGEEEGWTPNKNLPPLEG